MVVVVAVPRGNAPLIVGIDAATIVAALSGGGSSEVPVGPTSIPTVTAAVTAAAMAIVGVVAAVFDGSSKFAAVVVCFRSGGRGGC